MEETPPPPVPPDDPAARFRKKSQQTPSGPAPTPKHQDPVQTPRQAPPYGLARILEDALTAPFRARSLFAELAERPAPGYGLMCANLAIYCVAAFAVNILHVAISAPSALHYPLPLMLVVGVLGMVLAVLASFMGAGIVHVLALIAGGSGSFARSYQIVSALSGVALVQALLNWIPGLWPIPAILAAAMTVMAVERLHRSPPWPTRAVFGFLTALALGTQWLARLEIDRLSGRYRELRQQAAAMGEMAQQAQQIMQGMAPPQGSRLPGERSPAAPSGLDLISSPSLDQPQAPSAQPPTPQQIEAMRQAGLGMLDSVMPMLANPALTRNMPPEQARRVRELVRMVSEQQATLRSGKPMTPQEQARMMRMVQELTLQMMQNLPKGQVRPGPASPAEAPPQGRNP